MIGSNQRVFLKGTINNRRPVSTGWLIWKWIFLIYQGWPAGIVVVAGWPTI